MTWRLSRRATSPDQMIGRRLRPPGPAIYHLSVRVSVDSFGTKCCRSACRLWAYVSRLPMRLTLQRSTHRYRKPTASQHSAGGSTASPRAAAASSRTAPGAQCAAGRLRKATEAPDLVRRWPSTSTRPARLRGRWARPCDHRSAPPSPTLQSSATAYVTSVTARRVLPPRLLSQWHR